MPYYMYNIVTWCPCDATVYVSDVSAMHLSCCTQDLHSPRQRLSQCPLHWKADSINTGSLGKSLRELFLIYTCYSRSLCPIKWQWTLISQHWAIFTKRNTGSCFTSARNVHFKPSQNFCNLAQLSKWSWKCRVHWLGVTNISRRISNTECVKNEDWSV